MSSLSFAGNSTSYISIASSSDTQMGTGDFTIEWYQYQTDENPYPRVFQIGEYGNETVSIGVSLEVSEGATFYFWSDGGVKGSADVGDIKNTWTHFAIVRSAGSTTVYKDGITLIAGFSDTTDYNSNLDLLLGNETSQETEEANNTAFGGYMAYFHIVKGAALYSAEFSVPTEFPQAGEGTVYLIKAENSVGSNITVASISTVPLLPPGFAAPAPSPAINPRMRFSNNLVYYKSGSSSSVTGASGVTNSRVKLRKT